MTVMLFTVGVCGFAQAQEIPVSQGYVTDLTQTLSQTEREAIESELQRYKNETSNEIAVLLVPSTNGQEISDVSLETFRAWGIGQREKNNGVLMFIALRDRKLWITTGYGLEGALPDIRVKMIIDNEITPSFKTGNYAEGIQRGIKAIEQSIGGEYTPTESHPIGLPIEVFFIFLAIWIGFFMYGIWSMSTAVKRQRERIKKMKLAAEAKESPEDKENRKKYAPPKGWKGFVAAFTVFTASAPSEKSAGWRGLAFLGPFFFSGLAADLIVNLLTGVSWFAFSTFIVVGFFVVRYFGKQNWRNRETPKIKECLEFAAKWKKLNPDAKFWGGRSSSSSSWSSSSSSSSSFSGGSSGGGGAGGSW